LRKPEYLQQVTDRIYHTMLYAVLRDMNMNPIHTVYTFEE